MTPEVEQLLEALEGQRSGVIKKLAGLSDADARRSTVGSGTSLAGLLQHLTFVESLWFEEIIAGGPRREGSDQWMSIPRSRCGPFGLTTTRLPRLAADHQDSRRRGRAGDP